MNDVIDVESKETSLVKADNKLQTVSRPPDVVMHEARQAAAALTDVLKNKKKKLEFNGKQYLEYEDWLLLGQFYNAYCRTHDAVEIEINGVKGAKARADVLDRNGVVIGGAEGYCMQDEKQWKTKPFFQLASMAQTRAGSKAMANRLRWVAVLAEGVSGTPSEEMREEIDSQSVNSQTSGDKKTFADQACPNPKCKSTTAVRKSKYDNGKEWYCYTKIGGCGHQWDTVKPAASGDVKEETFGEYNKAHNDNYRAESKITKAQQKQIFDAAKKVGMDNEMRNAMLANLGYSSSAEVKKKDMDEILRQIGTYGQPAERKAGEDDIPPVEGDSPI